MSHYENALSKAPQIRSKIDRLENEMRGLPQLEMAVQNDFTPGAYIRTLFIPAGTTLVGKIHATEHIFMVVRGDITLVSLDGSRRVQAPYQAVCKAGAKRAGYAHTDTVCVNIHITEETDLERLESTLIEAGHIAHSAIEVIS